MARKAPKPTAYIAIYPSKGTRAKSFLSVLLIKVRAWDSELKGRKPIKSWTVKARTPLALVHVRYPLRLNFLRWGTAAYDRAMKAAHWDFDADPEPDVLAAFEGEVERVELAVGMLIRHGEELGIFSLYILPRYRAD